MCLHQRRSCECNRASATFFHRDDILPAEVLAALYCPQCRHLARWNPETMIEDLGWIVDYDMEAVRFYFRQSGFTDPITPELVFDRDYCAWYGLSPDDLEENARLHRELEHLRRTNVARYGQRLKEKRLARVEELKALGWRKATQA